MTYPKVTSPLNFPLVIATFAVLATLPSAHANLFVAHAEPSQGAGKIGKYTNSGTPINPTLITGFPRDIAVSGNKLFVLTQLGTVGVYTTSGQTISASLITGLGPVAQAIVVSGNNLFIGTDANGGTIGQYTASGTLVNASLITGLQSEGFIGDLAISGGNLFIASVGVDGSAVESRVGEYTLSGMAVNPALITIEDALATALGVSDFSIFVRNSPSNAETPGIDTLGEYTISGDLVDPLFITELTDPSGIAISGNDLYVAEGGGRVGKYTVFGEPIDPSLIDGLDFAYSVVVTGSRNGVPESLPTLWFALPVVGLLAAARLRPAKS